MKVQHSDPLLRLKDALQRLEEPERPLAVKEDAQPRADHTPTTGGTHDEVQLSAQAQELRKLREAIAASPDLRQEIVARLKQEIASGRFRIDGTRIAEELLEEDLPR